MLVRRLLIIKTVLVFYSNGCITSPDIEDDEFTTETTTLAAETTSISTISTSIGSTTMATSTTTSSTTISTTPACSQCTAAQVAIGATDLNTGAHPFDGAPTPGVDADGCSTFTYSCSGVSAYIEVNDPSFTVGNGGSGVQQTTPITLVCNAQRQWQYTGNGNVVIDPVTMLTCLSA